MYLNERAWNTEINDKYRIVAALERLLRIYAILMKKYRLDGMYVPDNLEKQIHSVEYPLGKWFYETDIEYRRLFSRFWEKRIIYHPEEEYEYTYDDQRLESGTEAVLNESFVVSPCFSDEWQVESLEGKFYSLNDDTEETVILSNIYTEAQIENLPISDFLDNKYFKQIYSYEDLWCRRDILFPHLEFCPSVEQDLEKLEVSYINQVIKKLYELERDCLEHDHEPFDKNRLSKTSPESEATLQQYHKEHTFFDEDGKAHIASWHMRFTGIPGRIFFVPNFKNGKILICYIGEKLKNVKYK